MSTSKINTDSPIEDKKAEIEGISKKNNDWTSFLKSILKNFITLLIWSIIWALIICVSCSNLDAWLPSDPNAKPYTSGVAGKEEKGLFSGMFSNLKKKVGLNGGSKRMRGGEGKTCKGVFKGNDLPPEKFFEYGFPYTMLNKDIENTIKNKSSGDFSFMEQIKHLFGESSRYSYTKSRGLLKYIFEMLSGRDLEKERAGNNQGPTDNILDYVLFFFGPLLVTFSFIYPVALIIGSVLAVVGSIIGMFGLLQTKSLFGKIMWGLFFLVFGFAIYGTWSICVGSAMYFQYIGTYLSQLYTNFSQISDFLLCNSRFIGIIFGVMLVSSANSHLDTYWTIGILIGFLIWFWNSKKSIENY
jgi:hypothetical protein